MKIQFLGFQEIKNSGCPVCGGRSTTTKAFKREKQLVLPSGKMQKFYMHKPVEVIESDGQYLLSMSYQTAGITKPMFKRV